MFRSGCIALPTFHAWMGPSLALSMVTTVSERVVTEKAVLGKV